MKTDLVVAGYILNEDKILLVHHKKLDLWLPVGGHIEDNEIPDQALIREISEEVGLDIKILNNSSLNLDGNVKENLATPFYVNIHNVGDHDHCCFFYVCKALNPEDTKANPELKGYRWFTKAELDEECVPADVKNQCHKAFELFEELK